MCCNRKTRQIIKRLSLTVPHSDLITGLRIFNPDFHAVKSKFGLLIEEIKKTSSKIKTTSKMKTTSKI